MNARPVDDQGQKASIDDKKIAFSSFRAVSVTKNCLNTSVNHIVVVALVVVVVAEFIDQIPDDINNTNTGPENWIRDWL